MTGKADALHTGRVTVAMLGLYLAEQVTKLTGGIQHPKNSPIDPGTATRDFPIALVK